MKWDWMIYNNGLSLMNKIYGNSAWGLHGFEFQCCKTTLANLVDEEWTPAVLLEQLLNKETKFSGEKIATMLLSNKCH